MSKSKEQPKSARSNGSLPPSLRTRVRAGFQPLEEEQPQPQGGNGRDGGCPLAP